MIHLLKDLHTLSLVLATFFLCAVLITAFYIYSLPHDVLFVSQGQTALTDVYIWFTLMFLSGSVAIILALRNRKEIIVYRNKPEAAISSEIAPTDTKEFSISLDPIKSRLETGQNEKEMLDVVLQTICTLLAACQGAIYSVESKGQKKNIIIKAGYALTVPPDTRYEASDGLVAQVATNGHAMYVDDVPEGHINVTSGLGNASPKYLLILPVGQAEISGVIEIASFTPIINEKRIFAEGAAQLLAEKIFKTGAKNI